MCGIVGYIGKKDARSIVLDGLSLLEYRGYDSAGIAVMDDKNQKFNIYKDKGRVSKLRQIVDSSYETGFAIGHTRWATHGVPNYVNSHPHYSMNKRFIIVHNGVIENAKKLKVEKLSKFNFITDTDTEVIANLIELYSYKMNVTDAIRKALSLLEGSYALLIIDTLNPDTLYAVKNKTPLLIGIDNDGITIASDVMALVENANSYIILEDKSFAIVKNNNIEVFDIIGIPKEYELIPLNLSKESIDKGNYEHYMLKEIEEQPGVIRRIIQAYFDEDKINLDSKIINELSSSDKIYIIACGTSYYAGLIGKYYFENLCRKPVEVLIASEAAYFRPLFSKKPFFIFISQSGETADLISCLNYINNAHFPSLALTNNIDSTISRLSTYSLDIMAGKEIAVASTKAYIAQVVILSILAKSISNRKTNLKENLSKASLAIELIFEDINIIEAIADEIKDSNDCFYIGRGLDYYAALESALKLKEISYIHTEGYPSGELKHGSIALIEDNYPVIALITNEETNLITRSNLIETESRGAKGIVVSSRRVSNNEDDFILPDVASYLTPIVSVVFSQLLSYFVSIKKGNDVDKPKNLAKSVTVE